MIYETKVILAFIFPLFIVPLYGQQINFDEYFEKQTLRFDFILAG